MEISKSGISWDILAARNLTADLDLGTFTGSRDQSRSPLAISKYKHLSSTVQTWINKHVLI